MAIADDFSVAVNGDIRYTGTTTNYTVIELHRWLGDLMDNASVAGDDLLDITDDTASDRSTDNIITLINNYNIDATTAQHLYDGSIIQAGGAEIYDGIVVFAPQGTYVDIIQNGALVTNYWTTGLNANAAQGISHRFMVQVRTGGADIDGRRLIGQNREFGFTYSEFGVNGTARGNNVVALVHATDLNNETVEGTVATWTGITNTEGYRALDVDGNSTPENYYSEWNKDIYSINQFFERMKWLTRRGSVSTIYGLSGDIFRGITHEINVDTPTGTLVEPELLTWTEATVVSSGQLLATDSVTAGTKVWIQLLTGIAPTDGTVLTGAGGGTVTVNVTVTSRALSFPFIGASTGSAIIGAYGIGLEPTDLTSSDKLFDLTNTQRTPPNNVTFTVDGLISGEDRILVGPESAGVLNVGQFTLAATYNTAAITSLLMNAAIPTDTPSTGTIRVQLDTGVYIRIAYSSYTGSTFTITSTDFSGAGLATIGNNTFISYIDQLAGAASASFTGVFLAPRGLFIRVRDGGGSPIKTFETTGTLGSAGGSTTAIRTSDV